MVVCTVAIPVYNREHLVCRALESALAQNVPELRVLVVDNCSTDETWAALNAYADPRLQLARNERNLGLFGNFNRCLELAEGKYLRFLCSDDRLLPDCLTGEIALMEQHPQAALLSTRGWQVDTSGHRLRAFANELAPGLYPREEAIRATLWILSHYGSSPFNYPSGVLLRRDAARRTGPFDATFKHVGDIDYWLRMLAQGDLAITDSFGCEVTVHSQQETAALLRQGSFTEEWFTLARHWEAELHGHGMYESVIAQSAACSLWFASYYLRKRKPQIARLYWRTATAQGLAPWTLALSFHRHVWLKALLRLRHVRRQPDFACDPL